MKTKLFVLSMLSLLLSSCGEKSTRSATPPAKKDGILLTTELPPEELIGTPPPVVLPTGTVIHSELHFK